ncbi:MAG: hypothetical protein ACFE95_11125 [Candidatus Hodarchaeota archaeon]
MVSLDGVPSNIIAEINPDILKTFQTSQDFDDLEYQLGKFIHEQFPPEEAFFGPVEVIKDARRWLTEAKEILARKLCKYQPDKIETTLTVAYITTIINNTFHLAEGISVLLGILILRRAAGKVSQWLCNENENEKKD